jgi:hypothetical protein
MCRRHAEQIVEAHPKNGRRRAGNFQIGALYRRGLC